MGLRLWQCESDINHERTNGHIKDKGMYKIRWDKEMDLKNPSLKALSKTIAGRDAEVTPANQLILHVV